MSSGLGAAFGYDLAQTLPDPAERRRTFSRLRAASALGVLGSLASAGALYQAHPNAPFLLSAVLALVAGGIALTIPDLRNTSRQHEGLRDVAAWAVSTLSSARTGPVLAGAGAYFLLTWSIQILHQPLALDVGLDPNAIARMFTLCAAAGMLGTLAAARWGHGSAWPAQVASGLAVSTMCMLTGAMPSLGPWLFLPLLAFAAALGWTVTEYSVTDAVPSQFRSTALSLVSALGGMGIAVARPALLIGAERLSVPVSAAWWGVFGMVLVALFTLGGLALRRLRGRFPGVKVESP